MKQRVDALIQAATGQASIDGLVDSIHSQIHSARSMFTLTEANIKSLINDFAEGMIEGKWGEPAGIMLPGTGVQKALTGYLMKGVKGKGGIDNLTEKAEQAKNDFHDILFKIAATNLARQDSISDQHIECFKNYVSSYPEVAIRNADFISNNHRAVDSALQALGDQASQLQAALDARQHAPGQEEPLAARIRKQREAYQRGQGM